MSGFSISLAFLMGLTGSLHCAGMCGPLIWMMPFHARKGIRKWTGILVYHQARISVYAAMGWLLFSFRELFHPQWQQYIAISLGLALLIVGTLTFLPGSVFRITVPWTAVIQQQAGRFIGKPDIWSLSISGIMNGLLPCGLVYMALSATMAAPDTLHAVLMMYAFGAGTIPMLVALTLLRSRVAGLSLFRMKKFVPVMMLTFGGLLLLRGMNLGIPYLSPEITVEQQTIKASCCDGHSAR